MRTRPWFDAAGRWRRRRRSDRRTRVVATAVIGAVASLLALSAPADAGDTTAVVQACADLAGSYTLSDLRRDLGFDKAKSDFGLTGAGVDVAVIDTGVTDVAGLDAPGHVVDGPDLSFDGERTAIRHRDLHGHGTNMAAIIGGRGRAFGDGVAPGARIIDVKVGAGDGTVDVSQVIAALDWVVDNRRAAGMNIRVVSLAFGSDSGQSYTIDPLAHAAERAWKAGIVVVVAGGNDGRSIRRLANPAIDPFVIAVGAAERRSSGWTVPTWSSTGDGVRNPDLVAPGASMLSAAVPGSYLADTYRSATCEDRATGQRFLRGNGTSQAASVTAGAVALLLEQRPSLVPDQVKAILKTSTVSTNSNQSIQAGSGLLMAVGGPKSSPRGFLLAATPLAATVAQAHAPATGTGTLDGARGSAIVGTDPDRLTGQRTAFGTDFDSAKHALLGATAPTWSAQTWQGATWSGGTWSGATWSGATWSGATWSGATWSGATWSGATWSGATWSGATWSGATWSGATWSGATWSGSAWV